MTTSLTGGIRRFLRNRTAVMAAAATGFLLGAAGFAAADGLGSGDDTSATSTTGVTVPSTTGVTVPSTTGVTVPSTTGVTVPSTTGVTVPSTTGVTVPSTTGVTVPSTNPGSSSTTAVSAPSTTIGGSSSTSTTIDDDGGSVAPFTRSYDSSGGSITVTWNGSSLSLDAVSPRPGYQAEIEDNGGDRVRVDFESDDHDSRIEIRVNDGELRERIEG